VVHAEKISLPDSKIDTAPIAGMDLRTPEQTKAGGDSSMEFQEITLGEITYEVRRTYTGSRTAAELVRDRLVRAEKESSSFDGGAAPEL
jgi:hypothetical protein